jgi:tail protein P2 I
MTRVGTEPEHTPIGARLRQRTQPMALDDPVYGYAHAHLCEALGRPYQQFQEAFDPEDAAPFETILDPQRCPEWALPWLAQLVGIALPTTSTEADKRTIITGLASHKRGTPSALEAAAGLYLTGTKTVMFRERDSSGADPPYTLEVVTRTDETPDPQAVLAALMSQKPGGIVLTYRQVEGWDYQEMTATGPDPYSALGPIYPTYTDLAYNDPGGP